MTGGFDQIPFGTTGRSGLSAANFQPSTYTVNGLLRLSGLESLVQERIFVTGVVDRGVHAEEALGRSSRFEPLHIALWAPYRLMRILRAIVLPEPLFMRAGQMQLPERRIIGAQLVGHQQFRHKPLLSEKLAH